MKKGFLYLLSVFLFSCSSVPDSFDNKVSINDLRKDFQKIPLKLDDKVTENEGIRTYFDFYNINFNSDHYFGMIKSDKYIIATHIYKPVKSEKTVFFVHGFLLHSAAYRDLFEYLINKGYTIVAFDLPGHGMSSGDRAAVDSFDDYQAALKAVIKETRKNVPELYCIIGISTGSAVIIDYLNDNKSDFNYHILASPLIRSDKFILSKIGFFLSGWFLKKVKTIKRDSTSNKEALKFFHNKDPLKIRSMPVKWAEALYRWNDKIESTDNILDDNIMVIQGNRDVVVQWKKNIKIIKKIAPEAKIEIIENAKHDIYFEIKPIRDYVFNLINSYIK